MYPSPAFLLWREIAEARDWGRLLSMPETADTEIALWMLAALPTWAEQCEQTQRRLMKALLSKPSR